MIIGGIAGLIVCAASFEGCMQTVVEIFFGNGISDQELTRAQLFEVLDVEIPHDAVEFTASGQIYLEKHVLNFNLNFESSISSATHFASHFCEELHVGFDPFNMIKTPNRVNGAHRISVSSDSFPYYSYTPNPQPNIRGNLCLEEDGYSYWIRVKNIDERDAEIRMMYTTNPCAICRLNDMRPFDDFPLVVRGISHSSGKKYRASPRVCLEMDWAELQADPARWETLLGSRVTMMYAGTPLPPALITSYGTFTLLENGHAIDPASLETFNYCFFSNRIQGENHLAFEIETAEGIVYKYFTIITL
jgi:hypothetical protein